MKIHHGKCVEGIEKNGFPWGELSEYQGAMQQNQFDILMSREGLPDDVLHDYCLVRDGVFGVGGDG